MKKLIMALIMLVAFLCTNLTAYASTSFAVYSDKVIYGLNFDFPETDIKFVIDEKNSIKTFSMLYYQIKSYVPTVAMNEKGLFSSLQLQYPVEAGRIKLGKDEMYLNDIGKYVWDNDNVDGILKAIDNKKLVHLDNITQHELFADNKGNAVITEVGKERNELVPIDGDFIVMTNFKNSSYRNIAYEQVNGSGADRYKKIYKYILDNKKDFDINKAFEGLKLSTQDEGTFNTQCSMVFDPAEKNVYIALDRNFDKLWKISVSDKTIETYKGFDKNIKINIPENGVAAEYMKRGDYSKYQTDADTVLTPPGSSRDIEDITSTKRDSASIIITIVAILIVAVFVFVTLNKKQKDMNV